LVRKPYRPQWTPFVAESYRVRRNESWLPFLAGDDRSFAVASVGAGGEGVAGFLALFGRAGV
jgi:hypothetical protein